MITTKLQVRIRCCSMAGWVVEHMECRSDVYRAARQGRRSAAWLCVLSGLHPRHAISSHGWSSIAGN